MKWDLLGWVVVCAGCANVPRPADVTSQVASEWMARRVSCLDVRVAPMKAPLVPAGALVFAFDFVNTCGTATQIDFTKVRVEDRLPDGGTATFSMFDPGDDVHAAIIAARSEGAEAIEFDPPAGRLATLPDVDRVCVDVGAMWDGSRVPPVCFDRAAGQLPSSQSASPPLVGGSKRALPPREVSVVVGYRRFGRFGDGWEQRDSVLPVRTASEFDAIATPSPFRSYYPVGSWFLDTDTPSAGSRRTVCADVRVDAVRARIAKTSIALAFRIGNRCARALRVALANAEVRAVWADGSERVLALYDPAREVHEPVLDGRAQATELLEYAEPYGSPSGPARSVCVDVSRVIEGDAPVEPICLASRGLFANEDTIVGHQRFDPEAWRRSALRWLIEAGLDTNYIDLHGVTWQGATSSKKSFALDVSRLKSGNSYNLDVRIVPWVAMPFYAGAVAEFGVGPVAGSVPFAIDGTSVRSDNVFGDFAVGALGGVALPGSSVLRARFDVTVGARAILSELFPTGCNSPTCEWDVGVVRPLIEPRAALDAWISPWVSLVAWVDADALNLPDFGVGLSVALHLWAYDGQL